jgi:hypothetical protein
MELVLVLAAGMLLLFALTICIGPPYVPTSRGKIAVALDLLRLPAGAMVVDLGSGDGTFLLAAAQRGLVAYGYEVNPLLWGLSKLRCRRYGGQVNIVLCDFWSTPLPPEAKAVFVFAAAPFMSRLAEKLQQESAQRGSPLSAISYLFAVPGRQSLAARQGMLLYRFDP